jgi:cytochrome c-type biogenesis protein CcmH
MSFKSSRAFVLVAALMLSAVSVAKEAEPAAQDPALESRVLGLANELRCLVCQNQTIADSNAPLALDLRNQIREQLKGGKSERDVIDFMVARYGDFILYRPPLKAATVLLWVGPFLLLFAGVFFLLRRIARRRPEPLELTAEERKRAEQLLSQ